MNVSKIALLACSLTVMATAALSTEMAHAQSVQTGQGATAAQQEQVVQMSPAHRSDATERGRTSARPVRKAQECVGPVSFCNIFFGS